MPFRTRRLGSFIKSVTANLGKLGGGAEDSIITSVANFTVLGIQLVEDGESDWDSKVKFECSNDRENWEDLECVNASDGTDNRAETETAGDEGLWLADVAGIKYVKISSTSDGEAGHVEVIVTKE